MAEHFSGVWAEMTWRPYIPLPPSAELRDHEAELARLRAEDGRGSSRALAAFQALSQAYAHRGRRVDELRTHSPDEAERFFANTAPGPDGHVYWLPRGRRFTRNDGASRAPIRWWWEARFDELEQYDVIKPACGDLACINPEHAVLEPRADLRRRFSDEQIIGALQVAALRLGRAPRQRAWDGVPSRETIQARFGGWDKALKAAGIERDDWRGAHRASPADCVAALRAAREHLGHWPWLWEFRAGKPREHLKRLGLPSSATTIVAHLGGSWAEALRRAGKR